MAITKRTKIIIIASVCAFVVVTLPILSAGIYAAVPLRADAPEYTWTQTDDFNTFRENQGRAFRAPTNRATKVLILSKPDNKLVKEKKPDLIVLLNYNPGNLWNNLKCNKFIRTMDGYEIPWAVTLGNISNGKATRNYIAQMLEHTSQGIFINTSTRNYFINLQIQSQITHTLYLIADTNNDWLTWAKTGNNTPHTILQSQTHGTLLEVA